MASDLVNPTAGALAAEGTEVQRKLQTKLAAGWDWADLPEGHVLLKMGARLGQLLEEADYNEMYGITLLAPTESQPNPAFSTCLIMQKYLRANSNDVSKACEQLLRALKWRKEFQPLKVKEELFEQDKFGGLGYVTELKGVPGSPNDTDIATFNIYGAVKDTKKTFGDLESFIRWRVALMELTLERLHLDKAQKPIPDFNRGPDPHQAIQIHDYLSVSFLRQPAEVKAASQKTIQLFQDVYPETMSKKYFVNVPLVMQWMFGAMQMFMAKETVAKMKWMSYGTELHKDLGSSVPKEYGGSGPELAASGKTPKGTGADSSVAAAVAAEPTAGATA
ncbi:hypothetical protein MBLNU459_g0561t1 [Dothideomycetes sp. NU459]